MKGGIITMLTEPFMQRALLAALFLGPLCALLGVFVTARRMAFFSDTIAHAALAGIAIGLWLGLSDPTLPMVLFSLLVAAAILWLKQHTNLLTDTIMALLLSGSVALGLVILSVLKRTPGQIHSYLFGDILAVAPAEVGLAGALSIVSAVALFWFLSPLALLTAHEEMAYVSGVRVGAFNYLFILLVTCTVALSIRLLGIILVTSLIVIPPAAARNLSRNLRQQIIWSILLGGFGAVGGTMAAYHWDLPAGPAIVLTCIALFIITLPLAQGRGRLAKPAAA
ncbi:MAG TPA: metal ABC transporter permease [Methylomirabilota bacterium]|nr:metal ABC transporter permease [Methylomirabilota bacterium]